MSAKKKQGCKGRSKTSHKTPAGRTLMLIDNIPVREKALKEYQSAERSLAKAREQIETFETRDLPSFQRWESRLFGSVMNEIRQLTHEIDKKRWILGAIEDEVLWNEVSYTTAYKRVMAEMNRISQSEDHQQPNGSKNERSADDDLFDEFDYEKERPRLFGESDLPPGFNIEDYKRMSPKQKHEFEDAYDHIRSIYEMMTGFVAPELDTVLKMEYGTAYQESKTSSTARHCSIPNKPTSEETRLRTLYRKLARQLHPDTNPNQGWRERALWHEVQEAYKANNVERMEAMAGRLEMDFNSTSVSLPIQLIKSIVQDLKRSLRSLRKQTTQAKKHPAWKFSTRTTELASIEKKRRLELETRRQQIADELAYLTSELDKLAAKAARPRKKPIARCQSAEKQRPTAKAARLAASISQSAQEQMAF